MTIRQLKDRCWELDRPLPNDDERHPHYDSRADALNAIREARDDGYGDCERTPCQMAAPCWVVQCDGECENVIDDLGECYVFHHDSRADAEETAAAYDFRRVGDLVFCDEDAPEDAQLLLSPAELEAAGQLRLPGVA